MEAITILLNSLDFQSNGQKNVNNDFLLPLGTVRPCNLAVWEACLGF